MNETKELSDIRFPAPGFWGTVIFYSIFGPFLGLVMYRDPVFLVCLAFSTGIVHGIAQLKKDWRSSSFTYYLMLYIEVIVIGSILILIAPEGGNVAWPIRCLIGYVICFPAGMVYWFFWERAKHRSTQS